MVQMYSVLLYITSMTPAISSYSSVTMAVEEVTENFELPLPLIITHSAC